MPNRTTCPISDYTFAEEFPSQGDFRLIKSPPLGMVYRLTGSAEAVLPDVSGREIARVATWLLDQHRLGEPEPIVSTSVLDFCLTSRPMPLANRVERFYGYLGQRLSSIGEQTWWRALPSQPEEIHRVADVTRLAARLWTECIIDAELDALTDYAGTQGRVTVFDGGRKIGLTMEGWHFIEELNQRAASSDQAFVAMWFSHDVTEAYEKGIVPAIREAGYRPMRIDQKEHANRIDDEIIAEIRRSRFLVADFTCGLVKDGDGIPVALPRGGVYYEAGFAQGLGIPVIWMCREDHINHVHFDTRQFNHITWKDAADLRQKLKNRIGAVLGDGPHVHR